MCIRDRITLFPTLSEGAKCAPNLLTFHEYLEAGMKKNDTTMKQFVTSIAKSLHESIDGKIREPPRRLRSLISHWLIQKKLKQKTSLLPGMVLAILRFKQTSPPRTKEGKYVFNIGWLVDTNNCPDAKKPRDIPCVTKIRTGTANHRSVSYTHLTLPTICSV